MMSRLVPITALVIAATMAGCVHREESWSDAMTVHGAHGAVALVEAPPALHAWSAPTIHPAGLNGPQAVADTDWRFSSEARDKARLVRDHRARELLGLARALRGGGASAEGRGRCGGSQCRAAAGP